MDKTQGFINNTNERHTMTNTTEATLKTVAQKVFSNSNKTIREEISDVAKLNTATEEHVRAELQKATNIKWTISEIQNLIYGLVDYDPKTAKENKNRPFEMRVLRSAEQVVLVMEKVNPNAFGYYDSEGKWQDYDEQDVSNTKSSNYNVKFNDEDGFRFNDKGELLISSMYMIPIITQDVETEKGTKKEKIANPSPTEVKISQSVATGFFRKAYPQAKKGRTNLDENAHIENAVKLEKYIKNSLIVPYAQYIKTSGKVGNPNRLLEVNAKILFDLSDTLKELIRVRAQAEDIAYLKDEEAETQSRQEAA